MTYKIGILDNSSKAKELVNFISAEITSNIDFSNFDFILDLKKETTLHINPKLNIGKNIVVNFTNYKKKIKSIQNSDFKKAIFGKSLKTKKVIDATGGLGVDSIKLIMLGASVVTFEENKLLYLMLNNALESSNIKNSLSIYNFSSSEIFKNKEQLKIIASGYPDVIYLDPMFPTREKSSKVKKEAQFLQKVVTQSINDKELLESALNTGVKKVVVKRPKNAGTINIKEKPSYEVTGKSTRYDIYC